MKFKMLAASATMIFAASATVGQEVVPIALVLAPGVGNTLATTFQQSVSGLFVDTFSFMPANVAGNVSVTLTPVSGPVNFFAALLNDEGFSSFPESGQSSFSFQSIVNADALLSLTVFGFAGDTELLAEGSASYSGTVQVQTAAAIPEPETYALLLAGLGAIGAVARRRRSIGGTDE